METRIKELREDHDLTQAKIAAEIGITQRKYSYLETQTQSLSDELLCRLSRYYNVSVDYILKLTDDKQRH